MLTPAPTFSVASVKAMAPSGGRAAKASRQRDRAGAGIEAQRLIARGAAIDGAAERNIAVGGGDRAGARGRAEEDGVAGLRKIRVRCGDAHAGGELERRVGQRDGAERRVGADAARERDDAAAAGVEGQRLSARNAPVDRPGEIDAAARGGDGVALPCSTVAPLALNAAFDRVTVTPLPSATSRHSRLTAPSGVTALPSEPASEIVPPLPAVMARVLAARAAAADGAGEGDVGAAGIGAARGRVERRAVAQCHRRSEGQRVPRRGDSAAAVENGDRGARRASPDWRSSARCRHLSEMDRAGAGRNRHAGKVGADLVELGLAQVECVGRGAGAAAQSDIGRGRAGREREFEPPSIAAPKQMVAALILTGPAWLPPMAAVVVSAPPAASVIAPVPVEIGPTPRSRRPTRSPLPARCPCRHRR